jgi:tRNA(adenine34) deaminase
MHHSNLATLEGMNMGRSGKTPEHYMRQTLTLAAEALEFGEFPIAAIVVLDDAASSHVRSGIIARATTSEQRERRFLGHAELVALEEADRQSLSLDDRKNAKLFTNLEPCLMCLGAAMSFFLGEIYYGLESPGWRRQSGQGVGQKRG